MAKYSCNNTHHITKLPFPPHTWPLIVLLYIYIAHPNSPLCVFYPSPPQNFWGEGCVCVCGQFWLTQNPQVESEKSPSCPDFLWHHKIRIITKLTHPTHPASLTNVNYYQPHPPSSALQGCLLVVVYVPIHSGAGRLTLSCPTSLLSLSPHRHFEDTFWRSPTHRPLSPLYCYIVSKLFKNPIQ